VCEALERKLSILGRSRESEIRRVKREAANALLVSARKYKPARGCGFSVDALGLRARSISLPPFLSVPTRRANRIRERSGEEEIDQAR
jgi:hypothetical protein